MSTTADKIHESLSDAAEDIASAVRERLNAAAYQLIESEDIDVIAAIRDDESVLEDIASEWPYTLSDALVKSDADIVTRAILDDAGIEGLLDGSEEAAAEHLAQYHAETLRDACQRYDVGVGVDTDELSDLADELDGLAQDVGYVRNRDLDEVVDELDELSDKLSRLADRFKGLL